jgi:hypothetical protein
MPSPGRKGHDMITSRLGTRLATAGLTALLASAALAVAALAPVAARAAAHLAPASRSAGHDGSQSADPAPPGRVNEALAYDAARHELVMFGGYDGSTFFGDTWINKHGRWTQEHPARSPSARAGAFMAYDAATSQLLLFGGASVYFGDFHSDTWVWTGTTWRRLHPATSPSARGYGTMAYDAATQQVILFGGSDAGCPHQALTDTWAWNGTTWTQLQPATSPPLYGAMAYDSATQSIIMYGGFNCFTNSTQTWSWDGTTWTQLNPATSPGPVQFNGQAAYDAATGQFIMFGGAHYQHYNGHTTWLWTGTTWTRLRPASTGPGRNSGALTYDAATGRLVVFGGNGFHQNNYLNSTWSWDGTTWQRGS